ncbi:MAG: LPS assembly protein LptD [Acidobacteriota bacterium]|jgi:LPS-assembly protein|nr:MAG: hypothetical protein DIU54_09815 [Acidobacteriota bacterium]
MRRSIGCAALLSALLLWAAPAAAQDNPFASCDPDDFTFGGSRQEPIPDRPDAWRITLTAPVEITCNDLRLFADEVIYETDTEDVVATGNVTLEQDDLRVFAERAELNARTKLGTFYNASGTARIGGTTRDRNLFGTQEPDVLFRGAEISRIGPSTYTITDGGFTTCVQPSPRWEMSGSRGTIHLDRYALMRHVVLRVKDVPLFYLPIIYYPINDEDRATGFLLPTYGTSSVRGGSISNAFFWAIGRSHDATFFHDWFMKSGQGVGSEYRYVASPTSRGRATFYLQNERPIGQGGVVDPDGPVKRSYRIDGDMNQGLPGGFRLIGSANYFTDITALQKHQDLNVYSQRTRAFRLSLTGNLGPFRLTSTADQRDYFYGTERGQRTGRLPSINLALNDRPIGRTRIYYGGSAEAAYLLRQIDLSKPETDQSLWRFDGGPTLRAPLSSLPWLTATGSLSWRLTRWLETYDPDLGQTVPVAMTRQLLDMRAQIVGPVFARVFQRPGGRYATGFKHIIEPTFTISRTMPALDDTRYRRIVQNEPSIDGLVGGVTTVRYGITNRLLARRPQPGAAPGSTQGVAREILSVEIGQSYYTDARASRADSQYQTGIYAAASSFSPVQITAITRPADGISGQVRTEIDSKHRRLRNINASGTYQGRLIQVNSGWTKRFVIEGLPGFTIGSDFLDTSVTVRTEGNRVGGTYAFNLDLMKTSFVHQRIVAYFNAQCCGISFDWQSIAMPLHGIPADRRFGISFTLAGIGSFSNPLGSFGGR